MSTRKNFAVTEAMQAGRKSGHSSADTLLSIAYSWTRTESSVNSTAKLLAWITERIEKTEVEIRKAPLEECLPWFYDESEGCIRNDQRTFITIKGLLGKGVEQPVILQEEIGILGILCREFDGVMHFLMQAKIEPGNVNCVQISPTLQATKSNILQKHGGRKPPYLEYFSNTSNYEVVVDQLQSEQASRFLKKRNRNILLRVEEDIPVLPTHSWMTLGQIKRLMREDNLVNMDARTVLSCIPFAKLRLSRDELLTLSEHFTDKALFRSLFIDNGDNPLPGVYHYLNERKMFAEEEAKLVPLRELKNWEMRNGEFVCKKPYPFKVVFCDIAIEGREVRRWTQPLAEAMGIATFGLICCEEGGRLKFLVRAAPEVGSFDVLELGPTVQQEAVASFQAEDAITRFFKERLDAGRGVMFDHLLSEEGGRFYHEQNRNVLLRVKREDLPPLPDEYFLLDFRTLNELVQANNTMNIQLRNLLSLLEA